MRAHSACAVRNGRQLLSNSLGYVGRPVHARLPAPAFVSRRDFQGADRDERPSDQATVSRLDRSRAELGRRRGPASRSARIHQPRSRSAECYSLIDLEFSPGFGSQNTRAWCRLWITADTMNAAAPIRTDTQSA